MTSIPTGTVRDQYRTSANLEARIALHDLYSVNKYGWFRWLFDRLSLAPEARILELGCGTGKLWRENLHRIPEGWEIILSDASSGMLQQGRENLKDAEHPFTFAVVDAQTIPFPDAHFDAVIANFMLYHVPDRQHALGEIRRVLPPGDRLYAATIGKNHVRELGALVASTDPDALTFLGEPSFSLENGGQQLEAIFPSVTLERYEDALRVTQVGPLIAYLLSGRKKSVLAAKDLAGITQRVQQEIEEKGFFYISKDSGLFMATSTFGGDPVPGAS